MVFISKNLVFAALLASPALAAPVFRVPKVDSDVHTRTLRLESLERRASLYLDPVFRRNQPPRNDHQREQSPEPQGGGLQPAWSDDAYESNSDDEIIPTGYEQIGLSEAGLPSSWIEAQTDDDIRYLHAEWQAGRLDPATQATAARLLASRSAASQRTTLGSAPGQPSSTGTQSSGQTGRRARNASERSSSGSPPPSATNKRPRN